MRQGRRATSGVNTMKLAIDLPKDPSAAYKMGWNDLLNAQIRQFSAIRDNYLIPHDIGQQQTLSELNRTICLLSEYRDIQMILAREINK